MAEYGIRFEKNFSLEDALAMLEDDESLVTNVDDIVLMPPVNACDVVPDEDSGDEDVMSINNLPGSQLQAHVEINMTNEEFDPSSSDSEDNMPLSELAKELRSKVTKKKKKNYHWVREDLLQISSNFPEESPDGNRSKSPLEWFSLFFDNELISYITRESNRYARQKNNFQEIRENEVKAFIGILILSGYVNVPRRRMFWERERDANNQLVSDCFTRDKFEYIMSKLHVADNDNLDQGDKFAKVRPLFTDLNEKFLQYGLLTEMHSVDEAMVPYFGRHSCKQCIHGKPIRYGYKLWVGSSRLGYIYWFEPYQGCSTNVSKFYGDLGVGASVVLEYADALRRKWPLEKFHLVFDNFFTLIPLIETLTEKGFAATGTVRENRLQGAQLQDSKVMKRNKRGTHDFRKITDCNIIAVKWHDNNLVTLCSNSAGVQPIRPVKRYARKENKTIQVDQPHIVNIYNINMGGVDRSDQNIGLYSISIRGKKWYFALVSHCIDMAIQNAWHLHTKVQ